jgi:general secretion pathway protein G
MSRMARNDPAGGFTLLELLLVVLIISVLAAMIIPRLLPQTEEAKVKIAQAEILANIPAALDLFMLNVGRYPTTDEGLDALWTRPASVPEGKWMGPYVKRKSFHDPWGNPFTYRFPAHAGGLDYDLVSIGPDGEGNTDDDVTNWEEP